jgi:glycosyltransferase involved in cell wall biosynthesis
MKCSQNNPKIAIFVSFSGQGGVERMIINLCEGLLSLNCEVDLLPIKTQGEYLDNIPPEVNIIKSRASCSYSSLPSLVKYLKRAQPTALLAAKDRANQVAILSRFFSPKSTRIVVRMGTTTSAALAGRSAIKKWLWYLPMRILYPLADEIIVISRGVAEDMARITGMPVSKFKVVSNPVISKEMMRSARVDTGHPWFSDNSLPIILGAGRLTRQKDFATLMRAFARLHAKIPCRLVILGEGRDRFKLEALAARLGIARDVALPGFVENPYAFMTRASLFVLSSAWEGLGNVLIEAMSLGIPVVATDCPSGPREILANGRYGKLVPVGNAEKLAAAMQATLKNPIGKKVLTEAVRAYRVENSSRQYLQILLGCNQQRS